MFLPSERQMQSLNKLSQTLQQHVENHGWAAKLRYPEAGAACSFGTIEFKPGLPHEEAVAVAVAIEHIPRFVELLNAAREELEHERTVICSDDCVRCQIENLFSPASTTKRGE